MQRTIAHSNRIGLIRSPLVCIRYWFIHKKMVFIHLTLLWILTILFSFLTLSHDSIALLSMNLSILLPMNQLGMITSDRRTSLFYFFSWVLFLYDIYSYLPPVDILLITPGILYTSQPVMMVISIHTYELLHITSFSQTQWSSPYRPYFICEY